MRGREGEVRGREEGEEGEGGGEEGVGGGRRGGGRRERGEKWGGRGKDENFARQARAAPRREEGDKGREGGGKRAGGGDAYPPVRPLIGGILSFKATKVDASTDAAGMLFEILIVDGQNDC